MNDEPKYYFPDGTPVKPFGTTVEKSTSEILQLRARECITVIRLPYSAYEAATEEAGIEEDDYWIALHRQILSDTWNHFTTFLQGNDPSTGYLSLKHMEASLQKRVDGEQRQRNRAKMKCNIVGAVWRIVSRREERHGGDTLLNDTFPETPEPGSDAYAEGWGRQAPRLRVGSIIHGSTVSGDNISFYLTDDLLKTMVGSIPQGKVFGPLRAYLFPLSLTWTEVGERLEKAENPLLKWLNDVEATLEVMEFRLSVLQNVLYRYEAFGDNAPLSQQESEDILNTSKSSGNTPSAEEIITAFQKAEREENIPQDWKLKRDIQDWALRTLNSSHGNTVRKLDGVGVWVKDTSGVPGSGLKPTIENMRSWSNHM